VSKIYAFVVVL